MKPDRFLTHLFALARRAPAPPSEVPFGLETAVLAHWRAARRDGRLTNTGLLSGFRWAALIACACALCAGVLKRDELRAFAHRYDPETRVADSAISAGFNNE